MNWYNNIEEGLRAIVKLLRDNGINTTYSCHHAMVIEAENYQEDEISKAYDLLQGNGYDGFTIEVSWFKERGQSLRKSLHLRFHKCPVCEEGNNG